MGIKRTRRHDAGNVVHADFGKEGCNNPALQSPCSTQQSFEKAEFVKFCTEISLSVRNANAILSKFHAADDELILVSAYFEAAETVARKTLLQEVSFNNWNACS